MGHLDNGTWVVEEVNPKTKDGEYQRQNQAFRNLIEVGGAYPPAEDRYHLYVGYACPWAHRTLIARTIKGLETILPISVVHPDMLNDGWTFEENFGGTVPDTVLNKKFLREIYVAADPTFSGRVTVPVLFDKETNTIVNNESSEILRVLNQAWNKVTGNTLDLYPYELRSEIDQINRTVYHDINNGVYKCGFARTQEAYDHNVTKLFETLNTLEKHLEGRRYLVGDQLTEADIRLYTTLIRFDLVYYFHFKCNIRPIRSYSNLSRLIGHLYEQEAFRQTTHFDHIKRHYFYSHETLNPFRIVPAGPIGYLPDHSVNGLLT